VRTIIRIAFMFMDNCSFKHVFICMLVVLSVSTVQPLAVAGIAEFNAAMGNGDFKAAAAEAIVVWASYDKSKPAAAGVLREFAFVNYLAGDFGAANTLIDNLVNPDNELSARDDQASLSRVLADLIALRLDDSTRRRNQLMDSLENRIGTPDADNISLVAAEYLYHEDWKKGRWSDASASAALAAELYDRRGAPLIDRKRRAELTGVVSGFLAEADSKFYDQLVDLHDMIVSDVDTTKDVGQREKLIALKWVAQAWANSLEAHYRSYYRQTGSQINTDIKPREFRQSKYGYFYEFTSVTISTTTDFRPPCEVTLDLGKLRYPSSEEFRGVVGSVIVKMDFNRKGKGSEATLLAVVPSGNFAKNVMKAAPSFRLKPKRGQDMDKCRLERDDAVVPITFLIQ